MVVFSYLLNRDSQLLMKTLQIVARVLYFRQVCADS